MICVIPDQSFFTKIFCSKTFLFVIETSVLYTIMKGTPLLQQGMIFLVDSTPPQGEKILFIYEMMPFLKQNNAKMKGNLFNLGYKMAEL